MATDPVCGMKVDPKSAAAVRTHGRRTFYFCSIVCAKRFDLEPGRYTDPGGPHRPPAEL